MLNPIADPSALSSQLGFLASATSSESGVDSAPSSLSFSAQLQALMQARPQSQGSLGLMAQAKAINGLNDEALEQLAQRFSLELSSTEGETVFDQLSTWLAEQGLAAGFTVGQARLDKKLVDHELSVLTLSESLSGLDAADSLEGLPLAHGVSNGEDILTDESADGGIPHALDDMQSMVDLDATEVQQEIGSIVNQAVESEKKDFNLQNGTQNIASVESAPLHTDADLNTLNKPAEINPEIDQTNIDKEEMLEPVVQLAVDAVSAEIITEDNDNAQDILASPVPLDLSMNDAGLNVVADVAGLVTPQQTEASVAAQNILAVNQQIEADALIEETDAALISAQSSSIAGVQSSAPGLVTNPQQSFMSRQAQQQSQQPSTSSQAQASGAKATSDGVAPEDVMTKSALDANARVLTAQQQTLQNSAQQQILNLNTRELQALQQQDVLKASDMKLVDSNDSAEAELLVTTSTPGERKASSPFLASISYPLRHPQWSQSVGKRIVFMANQQMQQAQIRLNPEQLGPVQVRLQMDRNQMISVSMTAQHGTTREALEAAIPRLKEMLEQAGVQFDSVTVEDDRNFASFKDERQTPNKGKQNNAKGDESVEDEAPKVKTSTDNMIDFYA